MIIHYHLNEVDGTLSMGHVVTHYTDDYLKMIEADGSQYVQLEKYAPLREIKLEGSAAELRVVHHQPGASPVALTARPRLRSFSIVPPGELRVGHEATFGTVPAGTAILVNGTLAAAMDDSGVYEVTVGTAGTYHFRFELAGYRPWSVSLEAE